jgi:hypothetical protein
MPVTRQPLLGIASTLVVMAISLVFISLFDGPTFTGWVSYYLMCTIPASLVIGVIWAGRYPTFAVKHRQPLRGVVLLAMALAVGIVVAAVHFATVGGGVDPPLPVLLHSTIVSVVVALWMTIVWEGWPFTHILGPLVGGVGLFIGYYVVAQVVFRTFVNYASLRGSPLYHVELDPKGLFDAWSVIGFCVTAAAIMFLMLHFDLWPLTRRPALTRQPILGLVWTAIALVLGGIVYMVCTRVLGMTPPVLLTTVSIPFIFGSIVMLNMLGGSLFAGLSQPRKGAASALVAAAVGTVLSLIYGLLAPVLTGPVPPGPPGYAFEIWLASALLAVTFPFLAYHADLFQMWPFAAGRERPDDNTDRLARSPIPVNGERRENP